MLRKNENKPYNEYRGSDRLFKIDRDTLIIYTGKEKNDLRPFLRIGAGLNPPAGLLGNIENVVLPEGNMWNVGLEVEWLDVALHESKEPIHYYGGKDRITQMNGYIGATAEHPSGEEEQGKLELSPYEARSGSFNVPKDRSLTTYLYNDNFQVTVNGSRVLDYESFQRTTYSIDKEYELFQKILQRMKLVPESGYSFVYNAKARDQALSLYWNANGVGVYINPPMDYHGYLFQNRKNPDNLGAVIAASPYAPGFVEAIRRKEVLKGDIAIYSPDHERNMNLKKIYGKAQLTILDDSRSLPAARELMFFKSKTGSHAVLTLKLGKTSGGSENQAQMLFPLNANAKQSKAFDYFKGHQDLEFGVINTKEDWENLTSGRLILHSPGELRPSSYENSRMKPGVFPLVHDAHYHLKSEDNPKNYLEHFRDHLRESDHLDLLMKLVALFLAQDLKVEEILKVCREIRKLKVPADLLVRNNIHQFLRFMKYTTVYSKGMDDKEKKAFNHLTDRYTVAGLKNREWMAMADRNVEFQILFFHGKDTFLLAREGSPRGIQIEFPPEAEEAGINEKEYKQYLKKVGKAIDKLMPVPAGLTPTLELMERIFQERLKYFHDREKLQGLLDQLEFPLEEETEPTGGWFTRLMEKSFIPAPLHAAARRMLIWFDGIQMPSWISTFFTGVSDWSKDAYEAVASKVPSLEGKGRMIWLIPAGLLILILLLFFLIGRGSGNGSAPSENGAAPTSQNETSGQKGFWASLFSFGDGDSEPANLSGISENGSSPEEIAATRLVAPGKLQQDVMVPGEDSVPAVMSEVFSYADALARRNGFYGLRNEPRPDLRDPNLVFPGDSLTLPDGRLVKIEPGETIWKVATTQYKKDYARIVILSRQIADLHLDQEKKKDNRTYQEKVLMMQRLAVTPGMLKLVEESQKGEDSN